jgi:DNA repair protein RecN (Recombination protein N)
MLVELAVHNLLIVKQARLSPGCGLTVISGETGAGKSLLLDALLILLGGRAGAKVVGPHGQEASVTGVFQPTSDIAAAIETVAGVPATDGTFILRRRLAASGRTQAWLNDVPVTVSTLQQVAALLVEIRAQHEPQQLSQVSRQLELLDGFAGMTEQVTRYRALHERCLALQRELVEIETGERGSLRELDFLRFQSREIAALAPRPGELAELERRFESLSGAEIWRERAAQAIDLVGEGDRSVRRVLGTIARQLSEAPDERLRAAANACIAAGDCLDTIETNCREVVDNLQSDPAELERIEERRDAWYDLMRKHGDSEEALLAAWSSIDARIAAIEGLDVRREAVRQALDAANTERAEQGAQLAKARQKAFKRLAQLVCSELAELGMAKAKVVLDERPLDAPGPYGTVHQEILVATNPGLPPDRLGTVMSGGEAARLSLAFAIVLAAQDRVPVLVFDEVDSGVGGRLGSVIGEKLATLARERSVLVITHTPQVAAVAARHYTVRKIQHDDATEVQVGEVSGDERMREIADMLGGGKAALGQAKALMGKQS